MRKHGWPELLADYIQASLTKQFAYGSFDCALFCADWIQIATGDDPAADLRGYDSMLEAYRIVGRFGSMESMATQLLRSEPCHVAFAQRGDIVLMRSASLVTDAGQVDGAAEVLGICLGRSSAFPNKKGLWMLPTLEAAAAWKIA